MNKIFLEVFHFIFHEKVISLILSIICWTRVFNPSWKLIESGGGKIGLQIKNIRVNL